MNKNKKNEVGFYKAMYVCTYVCMYLLNSQPAAHDIEEMEPLKCDSYVEI